MATRVDLHRKIVEDALESAVSSLKRSKGKQVNPLIQELLDKDILALTTAIRTLTEVK